MTNHNVNVMLSHDDNPASARNAWETPRAFYEKLEKDGGAFTWDLASSDENHKAPQYFTIDDDSLNQDWTKLRGRLFVNPPYGRGMKDWVKKAYEAAMDPEHLFDEIVMLIPSRTDTTYFHDYIYNKPGVSVEFLRGRLKFEIDGVPGDAAPFGSMVVTFG